MENGRRRLALHPIDDRLFPGDGPPCLINDITVYETALTPEEFHLRCEAQTEAQLRFVPARTRVPLYDNSGATVGLVETRYSFRTGTTPPPYVSINNRRRPTITAYLNEANLTQPHVPAVPDAPSRHHFTEFRMDDSQESEGEMDSTFGLGVAHPKFKREPQTSFVQPPDTQAQPLSPATTSATMETSNQPPHLVFRTDIFSTAAETLPVPTRSPVTTWHVPDPNEFVWRNSYEFSWHAGLTMPEHPDAIRILEGALSGNRHMGLPPPPPFHSYNNIFGFRPARPVSPISPDTPPSSRPAVIVQTPATAFQFNPETVQLPISHNFNHPTIASPAALPVYNQTSADYDNGINTASVDTNPEEPVTADHPRPSALLRAERVLNLGRRQAARNARRLAEGRQAKHSKKPVNKFNGGCN